MSGGAGTFFLGTSIWKIPCICSFIAAMTLLRRLSWKGFADGAGRTGFRDLGFFLLNILIVGGYDFCISLVNEMCWFRVFRVRWVYAMDKRILREKTLDIS